MLNLLIGFIATTENDIDAIVGSLVYVLLLIGFLVAMRFAALHWIGMLRDVNRRFGGHVIFASIARTAVQLATIVGALSLFMVWFLGLLLIAFYPALVIASAVVLLAGLVGILAVGVAMVLGTVHIERELAEAAEDSTWSPRASRPRRPQHHRPHPDRLPYRLGRRRPGHYHRPADRVRQEGEGTTVEEDMVPEALMEAFAHDGRDGYRVRHLFGQDALAVVVAIGLTLLYALLVVGVVLLIVGVFGDGAAADATAAGVGGP